jgi:hypothetical protein
MSLSPGTRGNLTCMIKFVSNRDESRGTAVELENHWVNNHLQRMQGSSRGAYPARHYPATNIHNIHGWFSLSYSLASRSISSFTFMALLAANCRVSVYLFPLNSLTDSRMGREGRAKHLLLTFPRNRDSTTCRRKANCGTKHSGCMYGSKRPRLDNLRRVNALLLGESRLRPRDKTML